MTWFTFLKICAALQNIQKLTLSPYQDKGTWHTKLGNMRMFWKRLGMQSRRTSSGEDTQAEAQEMPCEKPVKTRVMQWVEQLAPCYEALRIARNFQEPEGRSSSSTCKERKLLPGLQTFDLQTMRKTKIILYIATLLAAKTANTNALLNFFGHKAKPYKFSQRFVKKKLKRNDTQEYLHTYGPYTEL